MNDKELTLKNLKLLRDAWEKLDFDPTMHCFGGISDRGIDSLKLGKVNECGTNCCALGYAPSVEGLEITDSDFDYSEYWEECTFDYDKYSSRIFPALESSLNRSNNLWTYLFGGLWSDNRKHFLNRIDEVIANDLKFTSVMLEELEEAGYE